MSSLEEGLARYFSPAQLAALARARVGIVGAGGLGSNVAMMLARSGVLRFTLADHDMVEASNLNRQAFFPEDVGVAKVRALSRRLRILEPRMRIAEHEVRIDKNNAERLFAACPIIIEAVDEVDAKAMLYEIFAPKKALYVAASGMGGTGEGEERSMISRRPRPNVVVVGDFFSAVDDSCPPLAPRVMQAAALQADAALAFILSTVE